MPQSRQLQLPRNIELPLKTPWIPNKRTLILTSRDDHGRAVTLWNLTYRYTSDFLQSCSVYDSYGVIAGRGDVGALAVRGQRNPLRMPANMHMSHRFQVGQRIRIHRAVD